MTSKSTVPLKRRTVLLYVCAYEKMQVRFWKNSYSGKVFTSFYEEKSLFGKELLFYKLSGHVETCKMPESNSSLIKQHVHAVAYDAAPFFCERKEPGLLRIIDDITHVETGIKNLGICNDTVFRMGIHAHRSSIDQHVAF